MIFFYICYHAGGSTQHLPRPELKRRDEESSPNDALTPKKGKTFLADKVRAYLPAPCLCKIKMCGSSKMA